MPVCRVVSCVVWRVCLLWLVCSHGKTLLAFVLLHFVLQGQTCLLLQVSLWLPTFVFQSPIMTEKAMAPHSSTLVWKIPWTEDPGGLQSMGSLRVKHDWATSLSLFTFMHWRKLQPTPVFLPGESQGWGSLVGCRLWGHTELDMTEVI